jgi:hypothetical protein
MTKEELKDAIREVFSDTSIKNAVFRLFFLIAELSHAYINIYKEIMAKVLGEELADELKYIVGYGVPIAIVLLIWLT